MYIEYMNTRNTGPPKAGFGPPGTPPMKAPVGDPAQGPAGPGTATRKETPRYPGA